MAGTGPSNARSAYVAAVGEIDERAAHLRGIRGAGRIVGIDGDDGAGVRGDLRADVVEVGKPAAIGIGPIEGGARADLGEHRGVERIGRHRHQHVVAGPRERGERQLDALGGAERHEYPIGGHRHAARGALRSDGLAGWQDAHRRRVAVVPVPHRALDRFDEVRGGLEAENDGVPDVQIPDFPAGRLDLLRLRHDVPDGVDEPGNALRGRDLGAGTRGHEPGFYRR
jgi:hypothetical protein